MCIRDSHIALKAGDLACKEDVGVLLEAEPCAQDVYKRQPKTLRASMGAAVRIPVIEAGKMPEAIALLRQKGITCLAAALYQSQPLSAAASGYPDGVCVVIGSEGQGLSLIHI